MCEGREVCVRGGRYVCGEGGVCEGREVCVRGGRCV